MASKYKILVTAIGSQAASYVINSYKKLGYQVVGTDIYIRQLLPNANLVDEFYNVPLIYKEKEYAQRLLEICTKEKINYLIPLTDPEVDLLCNYHEIFANTGTRICIEQSQTIHLLRDKLAWSKFFFKFSDINIIPTYSNFAEYQTYSGLFPLVVKPQKGRSSEGYYKANNIDDLPLSIRQSEKYVFQPWFDGEIIVSDIFADGKTVWAVMHRKEWVRTKNGMGTAVEVFKDERLTKMIHAVISKIPFRGTLNIETLKMGDRYHLMDINPRFSAGIAFSGLAGYDFAEQHINLYHGIANKKLLDYPDLFAVKQYHEIIMT